MRISSSLLLVALGALALPARAGLHFNGDVYGGRYEPSGALAFNGYSAIDLDTQLHLKKGSVVGANVWFDIGHWNFGGSGSKASYKGSGTPLYNISYGGYTYPLSTLESKMDVDQWEAFISYEWDLAKYVPGVSLKLGPMVKGVQTNVDLRILEVMSATYVRENSSTTQVAVGGRLHLGFLKDILALDTQAAFWPSGNNRYSDVQARFAVHPLPFINFGVGYRDNKVEQRSNNVVLGYYNDDHIDLSQKGFIAFFGFRIGAGGN